MAILVSRLTGWDMRDALSLTVEEAEEWIADGVEVEKLLTRP